MLVTAKRLGWDHTMDVGTFDDYDPFDREEDVDVVGEEEVFLVRSPYVPEYRQHLVGGQVVDPKTIKRVSPEEARAILEGEPNG